ncbi:MAG: MCP four helix bundle domain-containing protein, partial [Sporomusaceae bacterium]|nr:MCP four helix bundle domain-containing protein [Sporomusaceae bacterium]
MAFFRNLRVPFKLGCLIGIAVLSLILVGTTGYLYLQKSAHDMEDLYKDRLIPVQVLNESRANVVRMNSALLELMLTTDPKKNDELKNIISDRKEKLSNNVALVEKLPGDATTAELINKVKQSLEKYHAISQTSYKLSIENKNKEAYEIYARDVDKIALEVVDNMRELALYYNKLAETTNNDTQKAVATASLITIAMILFSLLLLVGSGLYFSRLITTPLNKMVLFCQELASGDFRDKPRTVLQQD